MKYFFVGVIRRFLEGISILFVVEIIVYYVKVKIIAYKLL